MNTQYKTVKELLANPTRWTQTTYARDVNGLACRSKNDEAVCWCVLGACAVIYPDNNTYKKAIAKIQAAITKLFPDDQIAYAPAVFQDNHSHSELMMVLEEANV